MSISMFKALPKWFGLLFLVSIFCIHPIYGGDITRFIDTPRVQVEALVERTNHKVDELNSKLSKKTERYLRHLAKKEAQLRKKILSLDSAAAKTIFSYDPMKQMKVLLAKINNTDSSSNFSAITGQYYPYLDSLKGFLQFANLENEGLTSRINSSIGQLGGVQAKLSSADAISQLINQRKEQIKRYLLSKTSVPRSIKKLYGDYSKQAYYYKQEVAELKETLNDPDKILKKALSLASKTTAFKQFMQRNSFLSQFFNTSTGTAGNMQSQTTGLLTRDQLIQNVTSLTGNGAGQSLEAMALQTANNQTGQSSTDFLSRLGGKDNTKEIPDYNPNLERTKSFKDRLEFGTNFQTQKGTSYFPVTTDMAMSVGYKLNSKSVVGIGAAYKLGLGSSINNIRLTSEGIGFRSFLDYKIKGSFFVTGGFEYNYQQPMVGLNAVNLANGWAKSGLVGITKTIKLGTKFFKQSKVQLLWDFLGKTQIPQRQQFVFRVGYHF